MTEMLTIKQTAERLKTIHPDTPISEHTLRVWQKERCFRYVMAGRKILLSWDSVCNFLSGGDNLINTQSNAKGV